MLLGIERLYVETDNAPRRIAEQGPRASGEVLQPCADREHQIGLCGETVRRTGPGHADGTHVERMIEWQRTFAGLCLGDGNIVAVGEGGKLRSRLGIVHAAASDDQRPFRGRDQARRFGKFACVGARAPRLPDPFGEQALGIVIGFRLRVLT
jgi:hypothetical protein